MDAAKEQQLVNTGGPAFPTHAPMPHSEHAGMTMRDYFAAAALQGICASKFHADFCKDSGVKWDAQGGYLKPLTARAYQIADAMLDERAKART